ncbi:hypothetical protein TNCV_3415941, partial [Trichonephila clavipes]
GAQRINPENRVGSSFENHSGTIFSGIENIDDFLENIDHNLAYYEIPAQLACALPEGHLRSSTRLVRDSWTSTKYAKCSYKSLINTKNVLCIGKSEVRVRDLEVQTLMKTIVLIPGIDRKIGGKTEIMRDTPIIADHKGNLIDSKTKVSQNRRFEGRRQSGQSDQPFHSQGGRQSGSRNSSFRGQNERSRNLNF